MNVAEWLRYATAQLQQFENPNLEAEALLTHFTQASRASIYTWPERCIDADVLPDLNQALTQRTEGMPLAYLTDCQEFWSLDFEVSTDVLIPRPETELLVEIGATHLATTDKSQTVLDCGTGSGAIAISLCHEMSTTPRHHFIATDISIMALQIAQRNAARHHSQIHFCQADVLAPIDQNSIDLILSNPPYVRANDPHLKSSIAHEPQSALIGGIKGLEIITRLIEEAQTVLRPKGILALEHGYDQGNDVRRIFSESGYAYIETIKDLSNHDRVTKGTKLI